jgi:hypothetical protein
MKRLFFIGTAAMLALSCSSDDDNDGNVSVEGTWKLTKFELTESADLNNDGNATNNLLSETNCFNNSNIVFSGDGTGTINIGSMNADIQLVNGSETEYEYTVECEEPTPSNFDYTVSDNIITIDDSAALTRSGNKLTFAIAQFTSVPVEENGEITYIPAGVYMELTKQ